MFSTTPRSGTLTWPNIAMPRRASISARSCGVETITAPASGTFWAIVSCGVAGARRHVDDEHVEFAPHDLAQELVQRRHHHRSAPDDRRALLDQEADRHDLHAVTLERDELLAVGRHGGLGAMPNSLGIDGPNRSASSTPTLSPSFAKPTARLQATVDLPTPPLPEATAMMCLTPGSGSLDRPCRRGGEHRLDGHAGGAATVRATSAVSVTTAPATPGSRLDRGLRPGAHRLHRLRPRRIDGDGDEDLAVANGHAGDRARIRAAARARRGRGPPLAPPSPRRGKSSFVVLFTWRWRRSPSAEVSGCARGPNRACRARSRPSRR